VGDGHGRVRTDVSGPRFFLYLPQLRMDVDAVVERAVAAEAAGFEGVAFMDHLAPPLAVTSPMYEALTLATWVAARTSTLVVGHLVLCDALRHPAVLARQCVTLDHASGGRFELGLGSGSVPDELVAYGVTTDGPTTRAERLEESLELLRALWSGGPVVHHGRHFDVDCAGQQPTPLGRIPVVVGGASRRTAALAARLADWWNLPVTGLHRLDELRPLAGPVRVSTQHLVSFVAAGADREEVTSAARRRYGAMGSELLVGDGAELVATFGELARRGVDRCYVWFGDFAPPATLAAFGREVIAPLST